MSKRLFVGGLPYSLTEDELKKIFSEFGTVESCTLIFDKFTNQSKGFAFVEMKSEDAEKAMKALDGNDVGGRNIVVNIAKPREERSGGGYNRNNYRGSDRGGDRNFSRNGNRGGGSKRY